MFPVLLVAAFASIVTILSSVHVINEGRDGVYYKNGALLKETSSPGIHFKLPFITRVEEVVHTVQTDSVENVPCGTASGVLINFAKIEVVNRLSKDKLLDTIRNYTVNYDKTWIYDKIHHEVNQFCSRHTLQEVYITVFDTLDDHLAEQLRIDLSKWAPGIEIISVRVTKPIVPGHILQKFEQVEAEATNFQIATKKQLVEKKQAETREEQATIQARQEANVANMQNKQAESKKESEATIQQIENRMKMSVADTKLYEDTKRAEGNEILLSEAFLKHEQIKALGSINKIYFGEKIPDVLVESSNPTADANAAISAVVNNAAANVCVGDVCK
jgi:regulator of protease activity HflC (stomatin/prohibitin superfamily)